MGTVQIKILFNILNRFCELLSALIENLIQFSSILILITRFLQNIQFMF